MGQVFQTSCADAAFSWLAAATAASSAFAWLGFKNSLDMLTNVGCIQPILMSYRLAVLYIMLAISYVRLVICEDHDYKGEGKKET